MTVVERGQTKLSCSVDGIPYPSVRFMKDWRPLTDSSHLSVNNDPNHPECWALTIRNAIVPDAGNYVCVAENVAGKVFCTGKVSVVGEIKLFKILIYFYKYIAHVQFKFCINFSF